MMRRKAFTLIELTVAIGIIVVLMGMAFVALRYAGNQSRANATRVTLENAKSMLAEMEMATKLNTPPASWYRFYGGNAHTYNYAAADGLDFYRIIDRSPLGAGTPVYTFSPALVTSDARGDEKQGFSGLNNYEAMPCWNTAVLMNALVTLPVNRDAMGKIPADGILSLTTPSNGVGDPAFAGVKAPILLDGWHNPIIFVPGTAGLLVGRPYSNAVAYTEGQYVIVGTQSYRCTKANQGIVPPNATYWDPVQAVVAPNARPFFASAGPDGDFSRGDDNVYSFEQ